MDHLDHFPEQTVSLPGRLSAIVTLVDSVAAIHLNNTLELAAVTFRTFIFKVNYG